MKRRILATTLAALVLLHLPQWVSATSSRGGTHEPLQVTGSSVLYSKGTGQTTVFASLIVPHSDSLEGTVVTLTINNVTTAFTLDKRGNGKLGTSKASVRLGAPTCSCKDSSHLARLSVTVKGTKKKKSVFATAEGNAPTPAMVHVGYLSDAISFEAPMTVRK